MFPRGLIIFIIAIVLDIISKSIKDKKKIEESRRKRQEKLNRDTVMKKRPVKEVENWEDVLYEERLAQYTVEAKVVEDKSLDNEEYKDKVSEEDNVHIYEVTDMTMKDKERRNNKKSNIKNDILRGIIYTEILSEPKSLINRKRSM